MATPILKQGAVSVNRVHIRRTRIFFLLLVALVFISALFFVGRSRAFSTDPAVSFEVADYGLRVTLKKVGERTTIGSFGQCARGVVSGEYFSAGKYRVSFYTADERRLDCGARASSAAFVRSTGFYRGMSSVVQRGVGGATDVVDPVFQCTGSQPDHTRVHDGDDSDISQDLPWAYSEKNSERKCEFFCATGFVWNGSFCVDDGDRAIDPVDPATNVVLLSSHFDDELLWFEPWLHIVDTVMTPVMYPITPYQEVHLGSTHLNASSWILPQGKLDDENLAEYRAHNRDYRRSVLTDDFISSVVEGRVLSADVIVTHSPWGEYGHEQHRQLFCVAQKLALKYGKDLYIWDGMPDESDPGRGMPVTYHTLKKKDGTDLFSISLPYHRDHYETTRSAFRQAELDYPKYHGGQPCDPETNELCNYWSWDRNWNGVYGTYQPPLIARYYKMIERGSPIYDINQQRSLLRMRPYYPDESVFGRRDCLLSS